MNKYFIIGNLTRDPETGTTESGVNWCVFTVAARKRFHKEGEPDAEFVRVTAWRGLGDTCAKYLRKGRKVAVIGEPHANAWNDQDGNARGQIEMTADEVEFISSGGSGGSQAPTDADAPPAPRSQAAEPAVAAQQQEMPIAGAGGGFTQVEDPEEMPF